MKSADLTRPKAVIFDLGKVLVDFDYAIAGRSIAGRGRLSADQVRQFIDHSPLLYRFETGQISKEQFFAEIQATTGFTGSIEQFSEIFSDIFTPIEPMVTLHVELRERGVPTYIFSNTNELAVARIRRNFPFLSPIPDSTKWSRPKPDVGAGSCFISMTAGRISKRRPDAAGR